LKSRARRINQRFFDPSTCFATDCNGTLNGRTVIGAAIMPCTIGNRITARRSGMTGHGRAQQRRDYPT
ncbi:MAG: hypothetical protein ABF856_16510, partial [Acetobacter aceti]